MLKQKYKSYLKDGVFKKQVWMTLAGVMLLSNILLSAKIFSMETAEKTIIHPVDMTAEYSVEGDNIDPKYISKIAKDFLGARFLYTPKTVAKQFDNIGVLFHPEIYGEKKAELDVEASRIIRTDETGVFFPMSAHVKQKTAYIEGEFIGYLGKKKVTQSIKTFEVEFRNSGGRIWLFDWKEVIADSRGQKYLPVDGKYDDNANSSREG
jgi:type IV conjugative transfer system protein TraE